jgi:hypothetical protein
LKLRAESSRVWRFPFMLAIMAPSLNETAGLIL